MSRNTGIAGIVLLLMHTAAIAQGTNIDSLAGVIISEVSAERLQRDIVTLTGFHNRNTFSDTLGESRGIGAARRWLYGSFLETSRLTGGRMRVYMDWFRQPIPERYREAAGCDTLRMANVIAVIPGMRSERTLMVTAHYDSRNERPDDTRGFAPGADDDGSGVAALLELARVLGGRALNNTVILAAVCGEEQGLYGSTHLADDALENGIPLEGVIANDMIGNITGGGGATDNTRLRCFSADPPDSPSRHLARYLDRIVSRYYPPLRLSMIFRLDRFGRGGDHAPFVEKGFAGVRFTEPWEDFRVQHSGDDTPERMDFPYLAKTAALNAVAVWYWAMSPSPSRVLSVSRTGEYRTVISFSCSEPAESLAGFTLRIRDSDSPYWQESRTVPVPAPSTSGRRGRTFSITLDERDIDYYIFGLASRNREGFTSITATYDRNLLKKAAGGRDR
ncbi:M20/M25/M40 family metallo-hydrolase [bacterium]|nr:M20/M25/M40 family metallo-hydrolase [bacterium]